jgi:hypothetical protein
MEANYPDAPMFDHLPAARQVQCSFLSPAPKGPPLLNESDEDKGKVFRMMVNFQQGITIKYYSMKNIYTE